MLSIIDENSKMIWKHYGSYLVTIKATAENYFYRWKIRKDLIYRIVSRASS